MLYEGQIDDGLKCIQNIRDRYDGRKRSPFNEAECGHHYARAMASWAAVLAISGFNFSGVEKSITFAAKDGTFFWSNGYAWGSCSLKRSAGSMNIELSVLHGELSLSEFKLRGFGQARFSDILQVKAGEKVTFTVERDVRPR
jgi:non-lysosomal glucosylceramidase